MKKYLLLLLVVFVFVACEKASNTPVQMPNVTINCTAAGCGASLDGDTVFVIVTKSGCSNADFDSVAAGNTNVSCNVNGCVGTVSSWVDANSNPVTEIISGTHDICSYIDGNNNTSQDAGELKSEESVNINSSSSITVEDWSVGN